MPLLQSLLEKPLKTPALKLLKIGCSVALAFSCFTANAGDDLGKLVGAAMKAESRPAGDVARDANRLPKETLSFFGLKPNMTVVELIPGGGWYTRILAPVLAEKGMLYIAYGTGRIEESLLSETGFDKVKVTAKEAKLYRPEGARLYVLENADLEVKKVDMVLTFRNYHNFDDAGRKAMNDAAFKALKKGGIYGVVDHTRRHMEPDTAENRRRIDPVLAIKEIEAAGFEFVDFSDLHARTADNLVPEVGHDSVKGQTDRWTLKFVKK